MVNIENFYKTFKIGIELEGEFKNLTSPNSELHWIITADASLEEKNGGETYELISKIVSNEEQEKKMLEDLKKIVGEERTFAYENNTCGTHIHFSFQNEKYKNPDLFLYDTLDFEVYFLSKFLKKFTRPKYKNRLFCHYAGTTLGSEGIEQKKVLRKKASLTFSTSKKNINKKFVWLSVHQVYINRGAEIRIYPNIVTINGLKEVISFTKFILLDYLEKAKTKKVIERLRLFEKTVCKKELIVENLNDLEKIAIRSLQIDRSFNRPNCEKFLSGDEKLILTSLFLRKKTAFKDKKKEVKTN
jgi:hypothetical protein